MRHFLMKNKFFLPIAVISLVVICALASYSNYQVIISPTGGFRYEPSQVVRDGIL